MGWVPDHVVEELRGSHLLGIFVHLATDPALHVWFGVQDVIAKIDSINPDGTVYMGGGQLSGLPTLEVLVNGTSDAVKISLSGIDPETGAAMLDSIPEVRGRPVNIGITTLDHYYQPMSSIIPLWTGIASHTEEGSGAAASDQPTTLTLGLAVVGGENMRSRPSRALWSSPHQKAEYPTDLFCDGTALLARGTQPVWPNYN
jgi:hypothetical protein